MSDTIQIVRWAIEHECPVRAGDQWQDPATSLTRTSLLRTYSHALTRPGVYCSLLNGACLTSTTFATDPNAPKKHYRYPCDGFIPDNEFQKWGGIAGLTKLCGACPANATPAPNVGGCAGNLFQDGASADVEEQLQGIIERYGFAEKLEVLFLPTTPVWYGLWVRSPISGEACELLGALIAGIIEEDLRDPQSSQDHWQYTLRELEHFVKAAEHATKHNLRIHVDMAPPGHMDFGYYTVFPHCPRCKAQAPVRPWQPRYSDRHIKCNVCGLSYSPSETASSQKEDWETDDLDKQLTPEQFEELATAMLMQQGCSKEAAVRVISAKRQWEVDRQKK